MSTEDFRFVESDYKTSLNAPGALYNGLYT